MFGLSDPNAARGRKVSVPIFAGVAPTQARHTVGQYVAFEALAYVNV